MATLRTWKGNGEALDDAALLGGALLGEAVQAHLLSVVGQYLVQMHAVTRRQAGERLRWSLTLCREAAR